MPPPDESGWTNQPGDPAPSGPNAVRTPPSTPTRSSTPTKTPGKKKPGKKKPGKTQPTTRLPAPGAPAWASGLPTGLAPMGLDQLWALANGLTSAQFNPLIDRIQGTFRDRGTQQQDAITGYTKTFTGMLGDYPGQVDSFYDDARAEQGSINAGLRASLDAGTAGSQAELFKQLAGLGIPQEQVAGLVEEPVQDAAGAAGALAGYGSTTASRLAAQGAAAKTEAAGLPGVAALEGLRSSKLLQGQLNTEMSDAVSALESQIPGFASQLFSQLFQGETDKAIASEGFRVDRERIQSSDTQAQLPYQYPTADTVLTTNAATEADANATRDNAWKARETAKSDARARVIALAQGTAYGESTAPIQVAIATGGENVILPDGSIGPAPAGVPVYQVGTTDPANAGVTLTVDPSRAKIGKRVTSKEWGDLVRQARAAVVSELEGFNQGGLTIRGDVINQLVVDSLIAAGFEPPKADTKGIRGNAGDVGPSNPNTPRKPNKPKKPIKGKAGDTAPSNPNVVGG